MAFCNCWVRLAISSGEAPRFSASRSAFCAARRSRSACDASPSSISQRHVPEEIGDRDEVRVGAGPAQRGVDEAQAKIDAGLGGK